MYSNLYNFHTTILRYFNVYGNRHHDTGQYAPVLGTFMKQKEQGVPLTITGDGKQKRDFINVDDVVSANILAAQRNKKAGEIYNVGSGRSYSIQDIANSISLNQTYTPKRSGEIHATQAVINKIKDCFGWEPKVNIEDWITGKLQ